jgi:hypothetical protein
VSSFIFWGPHFCQSNRWVRSLSKSGRSVFEVRRCRGSRPGRKAVQVVKRFLLRHSRLRTNKPFHNLFQGILRGKYHFAVDLLFDWFGISCLNTDNFSYLQNRKIQIRQTGGQWNSDTPLWYSLPCLIFAPTVRAVFSLSKTPMSCTCLLGQREN